MNQSIQNFQELHINLSLNMHCLKDYLNDIGTKLRNGKYITVTDDGNCWIIDPKTFNVSFDEDDCNADGKIKTLPRIPKYIKKIKIPNNVTRIGFAAFQYCSSLTSVTIPDGVTNIGSSAFAYCKSLTSVTIPDSVKSIGSYAFDGCSSLMSVIMPDNVKSIGLGAFCSCSNLTSVTIPDSVKSIGSYAFDGCSSLMSVTMPDNVTSIGAWTFCYCSGLKNLIFESKTLDEVKYMRDYPWELKMNQS